MGHINETLEEFNSDDNSSTASNNFFDAGRLVVPQWVVYSYFVFICLGAAMNVIHFLALIRCRKNGPQTITYGLDITKNNYAETGPCLVELTNGVASHLWNNQCNAMLVGALVSGVVVFGYSKSIRVLTVIMLLSLVDFSTPYVVAVEILTLNEAWIFPSENCSVFSGVEVLVNSSVIWLIICMNFHVVSIWNLHRNEIDKKNMNPLTSCQDESNECLVTKKENANRTLNIDYRKRKNDISVITPIILVIFVCFSLSIPNFVLSSTVNVNRNHTICAIMDNFYGYTLQKLLFLLRISVPITLLVFTLTFLIIKLVQTSPKDIDNVLTQKFSEIRGLLLCCTAVTMFYIVTSFQRYLFQFLHIVSHDFDINTSEIFKVPPLYNEKLNVPSSVYLSMLHYSGVTIRGSLYVLALPKFKNLIKSKIFVCCKSGGIKKQ